MKKILFAAVAAMAITGCSQNEEIAKAEPAWDRSHAGSSFAILE